MTAKNKEATNVVAMFDALASICRGSVYVIDFREKCFRYISNHDLFLCGHSVDEVMQLGYNFYPIIIHPDDRLLVEKIFRETIITKCNTEQQNNMYYFSFTFRIKVYPQQKKHPDYLIVCHKLVPIFVNRQIQFGVCSVTCSATEKAEEEADKNSNKGSGNLRLYYKNDEYFDEYSIIYDKWKTYKIKHLTKIEKNMLILSMNGENNESIVKKLSISSTDNLRHRLAKLYQKLGVRTMTQAIIHSINYSLIFRNFSSFDISRQSGLTRSQEINNIVTMFDALASICRGSVYIIDFQKKCFRYISNHDLFLCGHSVDEVMQLGYRFYSEIVHPDDILLLKKIFRKILKVGHHTKQQNDMHYFSFMIRSKIYPQQRKQPDYLMTYHKLIPIFADGQIQSGICLITCSATSITSAAEKNSKNLNISSDNLMLYYKDNNRFDKYFFKTRKWKTYKIEHLTRDEKIILILAMNGENNKSLAERLCTSYDNLQHKLTKLYRKLGVKTMRQALIYSINHSLLFKHSDIKSRND
jgi:DNA-binding NarL/FixJ family response regulator